VLKKDISLDGGYDEGYSRCRCFWGKSAGSLVQRFILDTPTVRGSRALDLGCGEGKNAYALARAGASVVAVDCSKFAIANGQREFADAEIDWVLSDAETYLLNCEPFDVIVMYGLLHCLPSVGAITSTVDLALRKTRTHGHHIVATFNNGPHDLSAHPSLVPTLAPHYFYLRQYNGQEIMSASDTVIYESHPHNGIPHFHSLTRLIVRRTQ
jgi:tellurite methyltransferase